MIVISTTLLSVISVGDGGYSFLRNEWYICLTANVSEATSCLVPLTLYSPFDGKCSYFARMCRFFAEKRVQTGEIWAFNGKRCCKKSVSDKANLNQVCCLLLNGTGKVAEIAVFVVLGGGKAYGGIPNRRGQSTTGNYRCGRNVTISVSLAAAASPL